MADAELLELIRSNPEKGYTILIKQYENLIYAIVLNKLRSSCSREDIDDCVSDVFIEFYKKINRYNPDSGTIKTVISTLAKRKAIDKWRKSLHEKNIFISIENEDIQDILPAQDDDMPEIINNEDEKRRLWEAVKSLGEPDTTIIISKYFYGKTSKEIALQLLISPAAVQKRITRALIRLKLIMKGD